MNRSAYLTTGLAVKLFSQLVKADIAVHGEDNIPDGPTIFVMNHFTRVETFILPYYIYTLTGKAVWSLAAAELFKGGLEKFFNLVGVVSTKDPKRDELILGSLLTGEANWIIFPEGSMVKTKKIVDGGRYMIAHPKGMHEPHTGAAALALRAELLRRVASFHGEKEQQNILPMLQSLGIERFADLALGETAVVPVNLTYYPIRAAENIASSIAEKLVKDIPERMVEEIMTEGTMLLSGVDLDIRFGKPFLIGDFLGKDWVKRHRQDQANRGSHQVSTGLRGEMKATAHVLMQRYMDAIYAMTTINHEHLFASLLRMSPVRRLKEEDFRRRVCYAAMRVKDIDSGLGRVFLHGSLTANQAHLLSDDRFLKYHSFIRLAEEKGVVEREGGYLYRHREKLSAALSMHRGRIDNPIEVMANEIEPLAGLRSLLRRIAWQPDFLIRLLLFRLLYRKALSDYKEDCESFSRFKGAEKSQRGCDGRPFLLPGYRFGHGVLLVHSYLAVPAEVLSLARYLRRRGYWVYGVRLPGHGTSVEDLGKRQAKEWYEAVETGYVLLQTICSRVVVGGVAVGGSLGLSLTARNPGVAGVFAISPPMTLKNYSTRFMPTQDVWERIMGRLRKGEKQQDFLDFSHGNPHVNYPSNPVHGIKEVGEFLEEMEKDLATIHQPTLILQADGNPVVDPRGSERLYEKIGAKTKEYCRMSYHRHVLINGPGAKRVFRKIDGFLRETF